MKTGAIILVLVVIIGGWFLYQNMQSPEVYQVPADLREEVSTTTPEGNNTEVSSKADCEKYLEEYPSLKKDVQCKETEVCVLGETQVCYPYSATQ